MTRCIAYHPAPYYTDNSMHNLRVEDTVEFFNLVLQLKLTEQEKKGLVAFMGVEHGKKQLGS